MTSATPPAERSDLGPIEALGRIVRTFLTPRVLAEAIRSRPNWVFPLLFSILLSFFIAAEVIGRPEWQETLQKALATSGQKLGELEKVKLLDAMRVVSWIGFLAAPVLGNLFLGTLLWRISVMLEGQAGFLAVFSFQLHAQMVKAIPETAVLGWLLSHAAPGTVGDQTPLPLNLAYFLPAGSMAPLAKAILESVEFLGIWYWVLVIVGLSIVAAIPWRRMVGPAVFLWALGVLIKASFRVFSTTP
jgi:hypothetical protein